MSARRVVAVLLLALTPATSNHPPNPSAWVNALAMVNSFADWRQLGCVTPSDDVGGKRNATEGLHGNAQWLHGYNLRVTEVLFRCVGIDSNCDLSLLLC